MILCVTLNPCLDKTLTVPAWKPGESIRGRSVGQVVGGKGNNVARALKRLGQPDVRPVTFLGGRIGDECEALLREDDGFEPILTPTAAPTRTILTVRDAGPGEPTAFFDPDPEITVAEAEALFHRVEGAFTEGGVRAITLSGSSPSPATHELFSDLIALAKARKVPAFLDTYGPALRSIWGFWPEVMQLNRREAGIHFGKPHPSEADLLRLMQDWTHHGVKIVVITDGDRPALAQIHGQRFRATPPKIDAVNPIGSGDCLLAGLVDGSLSDMPPTELLQHGIGCAVANAQVWDAGKIDATEARRTATQVVVDPLSGA